MTPEILIFELETPSDLAVYAEAVARSQIAVVVHCAHTLEEALARCASASALVVKAHDIPAVLVDSMPNLRWIQALTTGVDHLATLDLSPDVVVTNMRGVHGPQMAELAFLHMIALARDFPRMLRNQSERIWRRWPQPLLFGKTVAIVGVGAISEDVATRCKAFGMRVFGVSSHRASAPGFDAVFPREALVDVAREADFLIILAPYTTQNHHLISHEVIRSLKPGAILVNIARGKVVDEQALIDAVAAKRVRAGLDVFETEPPTSDNPLWRSEGIIMTPRIGGMSDVYAQQASVILIDNLRCFIENRPGDMRNITKP